MPDEFPNEGESPGECSTNPLAPLRLERFVGHLGFLLPLSRLAFLYPCVRKNPLGEMDVGVLTVQQPFWL